MRRGAEPTKARQRVERCLDHRDAEQRAGAGPDDLRVVRIDRAWREHDRVGARGLGGADDRAGVARIGEAIGDEHERRVGRQLGRVASRRRPAPVAATRSRRPARSRSVPARTYGTSSIDDRCSGATKQPSTCQPASIAWRSRPTSLDDEHTLLVTRTAAPQEAPQSLNPWVREGEPCPLREQPWRRRSEP